MWGCFSEGLSLRLRFLAFGVLVRVVVASGMDVSVSSGACAGAFAGVGGFRSAIVEVVEGVWVGIGAIVRVCRRARN